MKNIIFTTVFSLVIINLKAQVAIGKVAITNASVILEFDNATTNKKGIILSGVENVNNAITTATPAANNGTFVFDRSDDRVKMYQNQTWVNLSDPGSETKITPNTSAEVVPNQGTIIGSATSSAKGVLVLEAPNKAMVLPWITNPHLNVLNPYPGMMCYDTTSRSLAVFDGTVWNYWK